MTNGSAAEKIGDAPAQPPIVGTEQREFFVWVNPEDSMVQHNIGLIGSIAQPSPKPEDAAPEHLMYVHNPGHRQSFVSVFHLGVIRHYAVEYDLERFRHAEFVNLPSRLHALFLFENRTEASRYHETHSRHVGRRVLKRGVTHGSYIYSVHDSAWIDFLRLDHSLDADTFSSCAHSYWTRKQAQDHGFQSMGKPWHAKTIMEVLFYGRIDFPNKDVSVFD